MAQEIKKIPFFHFRGIRQYQSFCYLIKKMKDASWTPEKMYPIWLSDQVQSSIIMKFYRWQKELFSINNKLKKVQQFYKRHCKYINVLFSEYHYPLRHFPSKMPSITNNNSKHLAPLLERKRFLNWFWDQHKKSDMIKKSRFPKKRGKILQFQLLSF